VLWQKKRAKQALVDKEEKKQNEKIRMKATKETQDIKEELAKKEQIKEAQAKRQEKLNDIAAKKRIQEKIAADKEERRLKAERVKAEREGRAVPEAPKPAVAPVATSSAPRQAATEARLRLQLSTGTITKTLPVSTTLFELAQLCEKENGIPVQSFTNTFPKKVFSGSLDMGKTLKEADMVPSQNVIVK